MNVGEKLLKARVLKIKELNARRSQGVWDSTIYFWEDEEDDFNHNKQFKDGYYGYIVNIESQEKICFGLTKQGISNAMFIEFAPTMAAVVIELYNERLELQQKIKELEGGVE